MKTWDDLGKDIEGLLADLRRQMKVNEMLEALREDLMSAKSDTDLNEIVFKHLEILHGNPKLFRHVESAKRRIKALNRVKFDNYNMN